MKKIAPLIFISFLFSSHLQAQNPDRRAVYDASMDYINAFYNTEPIRLEKCVYPEVVRRGYYWKGLDSSYSDLRVMTYAQMIQFAKDWNKSQWLPANAVKNIDVLDVQDKTASVKINVFWGIEYLQLAKIDNQWKIVNILWQSIPKMAESKN